MRFFFPLLAVFSLGINLQAEPTIEEEQGLTRADEAKIKSKLETITFDKLVIKNATFLEAIDLLRQKSKAADPSHEGINFVVKPSNVPPRHEKVNLDLEHVTLKQVLRAFRRETGFNFEPQLFAILLSYPGDEGLWSRTFSIPRDFFSIKIHPSQTTYDVKDQLATHGVNFPTGTSAEYTPSKGQLVMITGDLDEIDKVEDLLEAKQNKSSMHLPKTDSLGDGANPPSSLPQKSSGLDFGK